MASTPELKPQDQQTDIQPSTDTSDYLNAIPDDVEMSIFDHLEELRQRIFYALGSVFSGGCGLLYFCQSHC